MKLAISSFSIIFLRFLTCFSQSYSTQVIASSGDEYKSPDILLTWTIGETITETITNNNFTLTQGFNQTKIIITSVNHLPDLKFSISAYPNPTSDFVYLKIEAESENIKNLQYQVINSKGSTLLRKIISSNLVEIDFHNFSNGIYLLVVFDNHTILKTFKILKQ